MPRLNLITTEETVTGVEKIALRIGWTPVTYYKLKTENRESKLYKLIDKLIGRHYTLTSETFLPKKYTSEKIETLRKGDIVKFKRSEEINSVIFEVTDKNDRVISSIPRPIK